MRLEENLLNSPFVFRFPMDHKKIKGSIERFGLLKPIEFLEVDGELLLYDGARRVLSLLELGRKELDLFTIIQGDPRELFIRKVVEELSIRDLNPVEKAKILKSYESLGGEEKDLPFPVRRRELLFIEGLSQKEKELFVKWRLPDKAVELLEGLPREEVEALFNSLEHLHLNYNNFRDIVGMLKDISLRDGVPFKELLEDLKKENSLEALKSRIFKMRYPRFSVAMERFKEFTRNNLPDNLKVHPPPYFEGDVWRIEGLFSGAEEIDRIMEGLKRLKNFIKERGWIREG